MACLVALLVPLPSLADTIEGKVTSVPDAEHVVVRDARKVSHPVKLAWIATPVRRQPFHKEAHRFLKKLVLGKQVEVESDKLDPTCTKRALASGRCTKIGRVLLDDTDVNLELIRNGLAWHDPRTASDQNTSDRQLYPYEQGEAKKRRDGLWARKKPVAPWEFRDIASQRQKELRTKAKGRKKP